MGSAQVNLELKARDPDTDNSIAVCKSLGAEDLGTLLQEDVYFNVPRGRLKLRRQRGAVAQLIAYERPDVQGQRESHYRIVEVPNDSEVEDTLAAVLEIVGVIRKSRRLFLFKGVRIHLDRVDGLGSFIEFEGVAQDGSDAARFQDLLVELRWRFAIDDADLLAGSYCDLAFGEGNSEGP